MSYFRAIIQKRQEKLFDKLRGNMIKYDRLWQTMKAKGLTEYKLYTYHGVNRSLINRLRHNQNVEVATINRLCSILDCRVEDVMEYFPDGENES